MSRTITPADLKPLIELASVTILDVRRKSDFDADKIKLPGAEWKDPERHVEWSTKLPGNKSIVIYCVRGGSVSNSVVDALRAKGIDARFIEGGIEAWKTAGGATVAK